MSNLTNTLRNLIRNCPEEVESGHTEPKNRPGRDRLGADEFSFDGFNEGRVYTKYIELLSDEDLAALNSLLPWKCFTVDSKGRRFGNRAWPGKRETPQEVPDPRIAQLHAQYDLRDKHVLELG